MRKFVRIQFAFMRKQPKQARSKAMVEAILEAASIVLQRDGMAGFGTRQVAEEAGISVGSLYQYFNHKDALLNAMASALIERLQNQLSNVLPSLQKANPQDFIRILIMSCYEVLDRNDGRDLSLLRHWSELRLSPDVAGVERVLMQYVEIFSATQPTLRVMPDKQRALYIGINSVFFNLLRYSSEPSPYFTRQELVDGLVEMLELYVQRRFEQALSAHPR